MQHILIMKNTNRILLNSCKWLITYSRDCTCNKRNRKVNCTDDRKHSVVVFYVTKDNLYDVIYYTNLATGHSGKDHMVKELKKDLRKERM